MVKNLMLSSSASKRVSLQRFKRNINAFSDAFRSEKFSHERTQENVDIERLNRVYRYFSFAVRI